MSHTLKTNEELIATKRLYALAAIKLTIRMLALIAYVNSVDRCGAMSIIRSRMTSVGYAGKAVL